MKKIYSVMCLLLWGIPAALVSMQAVSAENLIPIQVDLAHPGVKVPENFVGLSFEATALLPDENGRRLFCPENRVLLNLFHTLGIKSLRIGGNTSDRDAVRLPTEPDIDSLFAFARLADVKVIYSLRLWHGSPAEAARTAKYIAERYGDYLDCFSIGQEPSAYPVEAVDQRPEGERMGTAVEHYSYATYREEWRRIAAAILQAVPNAKFCGPGVHNQPKWTRDFLEDFGRSNHVVLATAHQYPGLAGNKVPSPEIGRAKMLSGEFFGVYEKLLDGSMPSVRSNSLAFRLEEANNFFNGGARGVSDSYAAALWGLEFLHWWSSHGAAGINFHTGNQVAAGSKLSQAYYTAFVSATNAVMARPLAYSIQMFTLGAVGEYLPVQVGTTATNLSMFATRSAGGLVRLTVINKGEKPTHLVVSLAGKAGWGTEIQSIELLGPTNFVTGDVPVTTGGAEIQSDGSWSGHWSAVKSTGLNSLVLVSPPLSGLIFEIHLKD